MRFADLIAAGLPLAACVAATAALSGSAPPPVHQQRYAMGTMFDIVAYHEPRADAETAIARALDEVSRLDDVLSHFKTESDVSRLVRDGRDRYLEVAASLYEVLEASLEFSKRSDGAFDVTIGPLVSAWQRAHASGRSPSAMEIAEAKRCVGFEKIDLAPPSHVRLRSTCMKIDFGGIGKGYAVDRALQVLRAAGVRNALVNAGSSSISAVGSPPGGAGWPVQVGGGSVRDLVRLQDAALSTSRQALRQHLHAPGAFAEIIDPRIGRPVARALSATVVAPRGIDADALSTLMILTPIDQGRRLLAQFPGASAVWLDETGAAIAQHGRAFAGSTVH